MQSAVRLLFPDQCVTCGEPVEGSFGLCGACWLKTPFITGALCDTCGTPLFEDDDDAGEALKCDDCMALARPWSRGRAALLYKDNARRIVLSLKHGDRLDFARPAATWMASAAAPLMHPDLLVVPIPSHWTRLLKRKFNQAAVLAQALAREACLDYAPDALIRPRRTSPHEGMRATARFANMQGAIKPHPKRGGRLNGRRVLLVDDVMTSGATFAAACEAALQAGACDVFTLALARVVKDV